MKNTKNISVNQKKVIIPEKIKGKLVLKNAVKIEDEAFYGCISVTEVEFSPSLEVIRKKLSMMCIKMQLKIVRKNFFENNKKKC